MKKRIGIMASSLQSRYPRGVHRVARSITERLAVSDEYDFICLTSRLVNQYEITYNSYNLSEWLKYNPLKIEFFQKRGLLYLLKKGINRIATLLLPPILIAFFYLPTKLLIKQLYSVFVNKKGFPSVKTAYLDKILLNNIFLINLTKILKNFIKTTIVLLCPPIFFPLFDWVFGYEEYILENDKSNLKGELITLNDLDLVISFELFEEIWQLPIETYSTKFVCWMYDAIPLRINEGIYWQPDRFANFLSKVMLNADKIICISSSTEKDIKTFKNESFNSQTSVIYLGHDIERFSGQSDSQEIDKILTGFGIDVNTPYLICLGAIEPRKNIVNILRACILLRTSAPNLDFQLVMVGQEGGQTGFYQLIEQARQYMPVTYTGYTSDEVVAALLSRAKVFLYPSLWEGFGIPILEAMTSGTIVVTSDVSSLPEVCGKHAIYCDPYAPQDIAKAIRYCLEMPVEEMKKMVEEARIHASQFTWDKATEKFMDIVREELLVAKMDSTQAKSLEINLPYHDNRF